MLPRLKKWGLDEHSDGDLGREREDYS